MTGPRPQVQLPEQAAGEGTPARLAAIPIRDIRVPSRHRKDMGDIAALSASIADVGLLHPIVVTEDGILITGERRLEAANRLEWEVIPTTVVKDFDDAIAALRAERDENTQRKNLLPSEAVSLARELEPLERRQAKDRQREHGQTAPGKRRPNTSAKTAEVRRDHAGETRCKIASAVGVGRTTLAKADAVVAGSEALRDAAKDLS